MDAIATRKRLVLLLGDEQRQAQMDKKIRITERQRAWWTLQWRHMRNRRWTLEEYLRGRADGSIHGL